jgi:vitamin B12/bleomycin/antimicrobial peptide transport system ATP-binding/permease protein
MLRKRNPAQPELGQRLISSAESDDSINTDRPTEYTQPGQWEVLKFIMMTPMSCGRLTAFSLVFFGLVSSAGTGVALGYYAKYTGQFGLASRNKDIELYEDAITRIAYIIVGSMMSQGLSTYCMKRIGLLKRIHLNRTLHSNYFGSKKFYLLNAFHSDRCDNIDSRVTSNIQTMTYELFSILQVVIYCLTAFISSISNLFGMAKDASLVLIGLACIVLLSFIVNVAMKFVSARVSLRVSDLQKCEGFFSFQHTRIKKNCESIAFYCGQSLELQKIKVLFESVLRSARLVIKGQAILDFLSFFYSYAVFQSFPVWIGKPPF